MGREGRTNEGERKTRNGAEGERMRSRKAKVGEEYRLDGGLDAPACCFLDRALFRQGVGVYTCIET